MKSAEQREQEIADEVLRQKEAISKFINEKYFSKRKPRPIRPERESGR